MADDFTGDMTAAVTAAFAASTPDAGSTTTVESTSGASTTETPTEPVSQVAAEPAQTPEPVEGPIPYPRFKEVNDGYQASKKELERLAWAKGIPVEHANELVTMYQNVKANPLAWTTEAEVLRDHPVFGPQLRSWAARMLGTRLASVPTEVQAQPASEPEPDLELADGTPVYSAKQLRARDAWLQAEYDKRIDAKLNPLAESNKATSAYVAQQMTAQLQTQAKADGLAELTEMRAKPHFSEHEKDIKALMIADPTITLREAYSKVFVDQVIPKLAQGQAATLQQKTGASSANPSRPSGAVAGPPKDFHEGLTRLLAR